jgi:hypothetical protein
MRVSDRADRWTDFAAILRRLSNSKYHFTQRDSFMTLLLDTDQGFLVTIWAKCDGRCEPSPVGLYSPFPLRLPRELMLRPNPIAASERFSAASLPFTDSRPARRRQRRSAGPPIWSSPAELGTKPSPGRGKRERWRAISQRPSAGRRNASAGLGFALSGAAAARTYPLRSGISSSNGNPPPASAPWSESLACWGCQENAASRA